MTHLMTYLHIVAFIRNLSQSVLFILKLKIVYFFITFLDCSSWSHNGADRVSCAQHLWVLNRRIKSACIHHHRARRPGQQGQRLLPAVWWPLQWDEVAEKNKKWVVFTLLKCNNLSQVWVCARVIILMYWCVFADNAALFWVSKHISLWGSISFNLAVLINLAVALFYPFGDDGDEGTALILDI